MENKTYNIVLYTDGGCGPTNPGYVGSGVHGYLYDNNVDGTKNNNLPSTRTKILSDRYSEFPTSNDKHVVVSEYINGYISYGYDIDTNNVAELNAFIYALDIVIDLSKTYKIDKLIIHSDSEYSLGVASKVMNNPTLNFNTLSDRLKNTEHYNIMAKSYLKIKELNIKLEPRKIKAHIGELGNEIADSIATSGKYISENGIAGKNYILTPGNKFWKSSIDRHPLLKTSFLYISNEYKEYTDNNKFIIMDFQKGTEIGKKTQLAIFGLIELKHSSCEDIQNVINLDSKNEYTRTTLSCVDLRVLYSPTREHFQKLLGDGVYTLGRNNVTYLMGVNPVIYNVHPQGLARISMGKSISLNKSLDNYKLFKSDPSKIKSGTTYINITDLLYDVSGKHPKFKIKINNKELKVDIFYKEKNIELYLPYKRELPDKAILKQLEKNINSVYLEIITADESYVKYNIIIDTNEEYAIYTNFYTSMKLI